MSDASISESPAWQVVFTRQAQKDSQNFASAGLRPKTVILLDILRRNLFQTPPPYEKLVGDLTGTYSRRINIQHRLVCEIDKSAQVVKVIRMWTHYE